MRRRALLRNGSVAAAALLAGCSGSVPGTGDSGGMRVAIRNETNREWTVLLTLHDRTDDSIAYREKHTLTAGGSKTVSVPKDAYHAEISVGGELRKTINWGPDCATELDVAVQDDGVVVTEPTSC
ncbi:hypothetical protein [Halospeciosus flavus]|uniref:Uncharacterized protein n=1 Tax=Halospeciosus flavus TaxID=3032283 RepID=A0ABD5Z9L4_9EURY|nr:hypothetical protein [Halospeciosus flavus]